MQSRAVNVCTPYKHQEVAGSAVLKRSARHDPAVRAGPYGSSLVNQGDKKKSEAIDIGSMAMPAVVAGGPRALTFQLASA